MASLIETVEGFQQALKADVGYRIAHHGDKLWPGALDCDVQEVDATDDAQVIATIGNLEVSAFLVDHHPVKPAFGFKVARGGRTVVFSGDTVKCDSLVRASKDADILVCEAFNYELMDRRTALLRQIGNAHVASLLEDAKDYHIQPKEAAEVAAEASVKHLVLTHVIPPIDPGADELTEWAAGMSDIYKGPITIGKDLDRYQLD